jgi:hypothetical protein
MIRQAKIEKTNVAELITSLTVFAGFYPDEIISKSNTKQLIGLVLDKSGSMAGTAINNLKKAAKYIVEELYNTHNIFIIAYAGYKSNFLVKSNHGIKTNIPDCETYNFIDKSKDEIIKAIDKITSNGRTSFQVACNATTTLLSSIQGKPQTSIILLTDGKDTDSDSQKDINDALDNLVNALNKYTCEPQIHAVGLTDDHDYNFLNVVVSKSPYNGTFRYIRNSVNIIKELTSLVPILKQHRITVTIRNVQGTKFNKNINLEYECNFIDGTESEDKLVWKYGNIFLPNNFIIDDEYYVTYPIKLYTKLISCKVEDETYNIIDQSNLLSKFINSKILEATKKITSDAFNIENNDEFDIIRFNMIQLDSTIDKLLKKGEKINIKTTKNFTLTKCKVIKNIIKQFHKLLLNQEEKTSTKDEIAQMYDTIFREKKVGFIDTTFKSIDIIAHSIQGIKEQLRNKYYCELLFIKSYFTGDIINLMASGDALAICIDVSNTEVKICSSFMSSCAFAFPENNNAEFNKILPIYLFEEHWKIAKKWINIIYSRDQMDTFPFLVLAKAIENYEYCDSIFNLNILELIFKTCVHIIINKEGFSDNLRNKLHNFLNSNDGRTIDIISDNKIFMMQLYVSQELKLIPKLNKVDSLRFLQIISEEEARRTLKVNKNKNIPIDIIFRLLNIDREEYIDKHIRKYREQKILSYNAKEYEFRTNIEAELDKLSVTYEPTKLVRYISDDISANNLEKIDNYSNNWTGKLDKLSKEAKHLIKKISSDYKKYTVPNIFLVKYLFDFDIDTRFSIKLKNLGLDTHEKQLTFALQNYLHFKNSSRKCALLNKSYVNPFNQEQSQSYLKDNLVSYAKAEIIRLKNKIDTQFSTDDIKQRVEIFARTDDELAAVGALKNSYIGKNFMNFVKKLQETRYPLAIEKIYMIIQGNYEGIQLYDDCDQCPNYANHKYQGWTPNKKNTFRLWKMNNDLLSKEEWVDMFDKEFCKNSVDDWYKRELKFTNHNGLI